MCIYEQAMKVAMLFVQRIALATGTTPANPAKLCMDLVHESWGGMRLWVDGAGAPEVVAVLRCTAIAQRSTGRVGWCDVLRRLHL